MDSSFCRREKNLQTQQVHEKGNSPDPPGKLGKRYIFSPHGDV